MEKMQKLIEVAQELGWDVDMESQKGHDGNTEHYIELAQHSPAGEDFCFTVFAEDAADLVRKVCEFYFEFDPDEHVEKLVEAKHNGLQGVPSVSVLIDDSEAIDAMLLELKDALFDSYFMRRMKNEHKDV